MMTKRLRLISKTILVASFFCVNLCFSMDGEYRDDDDNSSRRNDSREGSNNAYQVSSTDGLYHLLLGEHGPAFGPVNLGNLRQHSNFLQKTLTQIVQENLHVSDVELFKRILGRFQDYHEPAEVQIIDSDTMHSLNVLCGDRGHDDESLCQKCIAKLFPVQTMVGRVYVCERLVTLFSRDELVEFQKKIIAIRSYNHIERLVEVVKAFSQTEKTLLSFWVDKEDGKNDEVKDYTSKRAVKFFPFTNNPSCSPRVVGLANAPREDLSSASYGGQFLGWIYNRFFTAGNLREDEYIKECKNAIREKAKEIFAFYDAVENMYGLLERNDTVSELREIISPLRELDELIGELAEHKRMYKKVKEDPISFVGELFVLYQYLYSIRDQLFRMYSVIGQLDMLLSIVCLLDGSPSQDDALRYSLAEYDDSEVPVLALENYWHPLIETNRRKKKITPNTIRISSRDPHVIVISGDNNCGKTTALRAVGACLLLSRTMGIASAASCVHSLGAVLTSIDVRDTLGRLSRFEAQQKRKNELQEAVKKSADMLLILMDEPLSATGATKTFKTLKEHLEFLNTYRAKCIVLVTTHSEDIIKFVSSNSNQYSSYFAHDNYAVNQEKEEDDGADDD